MPDSILQGTKKILGLPEDYTPFDLDVLIHINSALSTLNQLGIGPDDGFMIENGDAEWVDFLGSDLRLNPVKTYVYLRVKMLFDPPATSFHLQAMKEQIQELEWRLNVHREGLHWTDPEPEPVPSNEPVVIDDGWAIDGGGPE